MQLKGFIAGAAVVSLAWLGSTAWGNFAAETQARSTAHASGAQGAAQGMTDAEKEAHVAEMRHLMEVHRNLGVCPYSGRSARDAVPRGSAPLLRQRSQPVEI
ncbi:hypothetical protein [Wenzhouxiangella sp. XN24]|uniref:hypothetical protein n=1 Tax=Wenzhouxiangella sp. XN24 TaxID=2713569 RepID=UPI0013EC1A07|nr:hypothetical protein [Wenzhouxiangella sp. XN24]NGX17543.1 hypothetical protein [Wenzhouxiangella sp. XN24]